MTAVVARCDATDNSAIISAIDNLAPDSNDRLIFVSVGNELIIVKYPIT